MIVGTEQRVYGVLIGDCYFDLRRIALVVGSESDDPTIASTVYYGNDEIYARIKNCGHLYKGYLSILFSLENNFDNPIAVAEIRKCATGRSYIFIESYGIATTATPISLWFNQGTINIPDWIKLNSTPSDVMPYSESSFKFSEKKTGEVIEISGCRKCDGGGCLICNITNRFYIQHETDPKIYGTYVNYGYNNYGVKSLLFNVSSIGLYNFYYIDDNLTHHLLKEYNIEDISSQWNFFVEYTMECYKITIYSYIDKEHVDLFSFSFDYLKNCTTSSISFSGCKVISSAYSIPLDIDDWNYIPPNTTVLFTASNLSTPVNKCFPTTYEDYIWDLNYGNSPVIDYGKIVSYKYPYYGLQLNNYSNSYNVKCKTDDIYINKTPKYLEKSTNNCVTITQNCPSPRWNTYLGEKGIYTNGTAYISLASGYGGLGEGTHGLFSFNISTEPSSSKLKITSNGNDYYLEFGWYPIGTGTGNGIEYIDGKFYVMYGYEYNTFITVMNTPTSIVSSGGFPMYWWENTSFWFDNRIMNSYASIRGVIGLPIIYRFQYIYNLDGTLDTDLIVVDHNPNLVVTSLGHHLQGVVFNNVLYMIPDFNGYGIFTLSSLTDYGTKIGTMNFNGCWSSMKSLCVHNGHIYVYGTSSASPTTYAILEVDIDDCKLLYVSPASQGLDYDAHLISCGDYLVNVVGSTGFVPTIEIYTNSDLGY